MSRCKTTKSFWLRCRNYLQLRISEPLQRVMKITLSFNFRKLQAITVCLKQRKIFNTKRPYLMPCQPFNLKCQMGTWTCFLFKLSPTRLNQLSKWCSTSSLHLKQSSSKNHSKTSINNKTSTQWWTSKWSLRTFLSKWAIWWRLATRQGTWSTCRCSISSTSCFLNSKLYKLSPLTLVVMISWTMKHLSKTWCWPSFSNNNRCSNNLTTRTTRSHPELVLRWETITRTYL